MYHENNIEFRIASADAISKFKATQAHSFLQVCRKEFEFDISAREVVLLSYDRFSTWLMKMEKIFLREEKRKPSKALHDLVTSSFTEELRQIESVCLENPTTFSTGIIEFLKVIHSYAPTMMKIGVDIAFEGNPARAFSQLAGYTSDYLQHVLISMHEFNNNLVLRKEPFVCVAPFCLMQRKKSIKCDLVSLRSRASFFRKKINSDDVVFTLKNYTEDDMSEESFAALAALGIFAKGELTETA